MDERIESFEGEHLDECASLLVATFNDSEFAATPRYDCRGPYPDDRSDGARCRDEPGKDQYILITRWTADNEVHL